MFLLRSAICATVILYAFSAQAQTGAPSTGNLCKDACWDKWQPREDQCESSYNTQIFLCFGNPACIADADNNLAQCELSAHGFLIQCFNTCDYGQPSSLGFPAPAPTTGPGGIVPTTRSSTAN